MWIVSDVVIVNDGNGIFLRNDSKCQCAKVCFLAR